VPPPGARAGAALRPRRRRLDAGQLAAEVRALEAAVDRLVAGATRHPPNRRLLDHLARERDHLFTFLRAPGVQATNWRAEQAIRPAVVCRKAWGGNRTWAGADLFRVRSNEPLRTTGGCHPGPDSKPAGRPALGPNDRAPRFVPGDDHTEAELPRP